jgi:hypothetical protein
MLRVPELRIDAGAATAAPLTLTSLNAAPWAVPPAALAPAPSFPAAASAPAPFAESAAPAAAPVPVPPAVDPRYDVVLDLDATIIGRRPEGESAVGVPLNEAEPVTVQFENSLGQLRTDHYLLRKGFREFLLRARADPNVRGIHIVSGSHQSRLNMVAEEIAIDGRPLSEYVDSLIGGEFLRSYSPQADPNDSRPIKDLALLGLKNLKEIDADLRRGDVDGALALPRDLAAPRERLLAERRVLVVDDAPEMVIGGSATVIRGLMAFKPAAEFVPKGADPAQRARILAMRRALWEHQNGEFGELSSLLDRGLVPGSPEWNGADRSLPPKID